MIAAWPPLVLLPGKPPRILVGAEGGVCSLNLEGTDNQGVNDKFGELI